MIGNSTDTGTDMAKVQTCRCTEDVALVLTQVQLDTGTDTGTVKHWY